MGDHGAGQGAGQGETAAADFAAGFLQPLTTPATALALLALGLLLGQQEEADLRRGFFAFVLALGFGLVLAAAQHPSTAVMAALLGVALLGAALVASGWGDGGFRAGLGAGLAMDSAAQPGPWARSFAALLLAAAGGCLAGLAAEPQPGPWDQVAPALAGSFAAAVLAVLCLAAAAYGVRRRWPRREVRIAARILAAWIVAVAVMMLALTFGGAH